MLPLELRVIVAEYAIASITYGSTPRDTSREITNILLGMFNKTEIPGMVKLHDSRMYGIYSYSPGSNCIINQYYQNTEIRYFCKEITKKFKIILYNLINPRESVNIYNFPISSTRYGVCFQMKYSTWKSVLVNIYIGDYCIKCWVGNCVIPTMFNINTDIKIIIDYICKIMIPRYSE